MIDLRTALPLLLPRAVAWAEARSMEILASGTPLTEVGVQLAKDVEVALPELVRLKVVPSLPLPEDAELRQAAVQTGLLGPNIIGLTLGHGIYVVEGNWSDRLISHECRHVHQYEAAGSIAVYLPIYLQQIVEYGYEQAPYEIDARSFERDGRPPSHDPPA